ncbi:hypothetical protein C2G38_2142501 [Gigaspora rosea]|uniref:Uncharacterized protein n=1 Tax=Gigaspora rosea TaxID=44941 RepID=A0A397VEB2_9GLOM|nr:hypothetical protein C2G38_2142501 [Gigaspora rosea]
MTANPTNKPILPTDHKEMKEFNLTTPIRTAKQLVETVRLLRTKYYFHRIPEEWIQITRIEEDENGMKEEVEGSEDQMFRVDMPENLEGVKLYLDQIEITDDLIKIPITEQTKVKTTIEELRKIFDFEKVPDFIFALPPLPQATWDIIP